MMKKCYFFFSVWLLCLSTARAEAERPGDDLKNVAQNYSFESGVEHWQIPSRNVSLSEVAKTGKHSLQFTNNDPASYGLIKQPVQAKPGQTVHISAWIKGENISAESKNRGAAVYVESAADGQHLGGDYVMPLRGTFDWTRISGSYTVPEEAEDVWVGLYLLRGTTGTAWFDDIEVKIQNPPPLQGLLHFPNYRSLTTIDNAHPWEVVASGFLEQKSTLSGVIKSQDNAVVHSQVVELNSGEYRTILQWKPQNLNSHQTYTWELEIKNTALQSLATQRIPVHVVSQMPPAYIDADGFTIVDGKRFFPFGVYDKRIFSPEDTHIERIAKAGFNTILSYRYGAAENADLYLDLAKKNNLYVIYSLKDMHTDNVTDGVKQATDSVQKLKNHDALLAWYINDELQPEYTSQLQAMYRGITELDQRPIYQVTNKPYFLHYFFPTADVLGTDPYPEMGGGINRRVRQFDIPTTWTQSAVKSAKNVKGVWQVLQWHDVAYIKNTKPDWPSRPPTLDEMRSYSYQALINGSKGILYFAYHWLWYDFDEAGKRITRKKTFDKRWLEVEKLTREIKPITEVILKDKKVDLETLSSSNTQYQSWQDGDKLYILTANAATTNKSERLQLRIPQGWKLSDEKVRGMTAQLANGVLDIRLEPQASGAVVLVKG